MFDNTARPEIDTVASGLGSGMAPEAATRPNAVVVVPGDGVGPEITDAVVTILSAVAPAITWQRADAGLAVFDKGVTGGVPRDTLDAIAKAGVVLKGPLAAPVGHGGKSANVTLRKVFELYGNVRPIRMLPGIGGPFAGRAIDLVIVRESAEDLYAGIEHMQTPDVAQCLKLVSRMGCEKIAHLAFAVARADGRKKVHCATKANVMKLTDGMMKRTFEAVARDYPGIRADHILIDNCAHRLVTDPEAFDVIVTTNMNGDIISDLAAGLVGGLGLAPSANYGRDVAMFEAVHGSAPGIAGKGVANPTALLQSGIMMLRHLNLDDQADRVEDALLTTLAEGQNLTPDLARGRSAGSTAAFVDTILANLGRRPERRERTARPRRPLRIPAWTTAGSARLPASRRLVGCDVFVEFEGSPGTIGRWLTAVAEHTPFRLQMVSNRGTIVFPANGGCTDVVDHWRCRFVARNASGRLGTGDVTDLLKQVGKHLRWMHVELLEHHDGASAYTHAQGEN